MKDISDANVLLTAFDRAIKTARWKPTCQRADHNALSLVAELQDEIKSRTYHTEATSTFIISERGKTRVISGNTIKDRTLRHALCDEFLMPAVSDYLIYDNGASVKDKGVDFARNRIRCHLQRYYRKHGHIGYVLLIDFSKYYDNILHATALKQLSDKAHAEHILTLQVRAVAPAEYLYGEAVLLTLLDIRGDVKLRHVVGTLCITHILAIEPYESSRVDTAKMDEGAATVPLGRNAEGVSI